MLILQVIVVVLVVVVLGNAETATKLKTLREIKLSGAISGTGNFDGNSNLNIVTTQANIALLTGNIEISNGVGSVNFNYPSGYNQNNCVPIAGGTTFNSQNQIAFGQALNGSLLTGVRLNATSITFSTSTPGGTGPSGTYSCKVVLMKIN